MFFIYANDKLIYRPMDESLILLEPKLNLEIGKAGSLEFNILPNHPYYHQMQQLTTIVYVKMDNTEIFRGRVLSNKLNFDTSRSIYCEGALSYLVDSVQKARAFEGKLHDFFRFVISQHNALVGEEKQFYVGEITVENRDMKIAGKNEQNLNAGNIDYQQIVINSIVDNWSNTLDYLESTVISYAGGYLRARYEDGKAYIDLLKEYGGTATQEIELGSNLLELEQEISAEDLFTVLIPLGDDNLTIETVNGFSDELVDEAAVQQYGRIVRTQTFSNVKSPYTLLENARRYMENNINIPMTLTVKAVDLHLLNPNVRAIYLGDRVHITSSPHGLVEYLTCTSIEYDIASPGNNTYTFGNPKQTLTQRYKEDWRQQSYSQSVGEDGVAAGGGALGWHLLGETNGAKKDAKDAKDKAEEVEEQVQEQKKETEKIKKVLYDAGIDVNDTAGMVSLFSLKRELDEKGREIETNSARIFMLQEDTGSRINLVVNKTKEHDDDIDNLNGRLSLYIAENQSVLEAKADKFTVDSQVAEINSEVIKLNGKVDSLTASYAEIDKLVAQRIDAKLGAADTIVAKNIIASNSMSLKNQRVSTWNHSHMLYEQNDGTIQLGYATANGGDFQSFKIADTKAYKEGVSAAVNAVTVTFGLDSQKINSDSNAIKFLPNSKSLSFPIFAQLYSDRSKQTALGSRHTATASISAAEAMKAVTIPYIAETEDTVQQYDRNAQTITTNITARTSEGTEGSANITVSARPAVTAGARTAQINAVSLQTLSGTAGYSEDEQGNHYINVKITGTAKGQLGTGSWEVQGEQTIDESRSIQANAVYDAGRDSVAILASKIQNGSTVYPYASDSTKSRYLITVPVTVEATNGATQSKDLSVDVSSVWDKSMRTVDLYESSANITGFTAPTESNGSYLSTVSGSVKLTSTAAAGGRYDSAAKPFSIENVDVSTVYRAGITAGTNAKDVSDLEYASYSTSSSPTSLGTTFIPNAYVRYTANSSNAVAGDTAVIRGRVKINLNDNTSRIAVIEMSAARAINSVTISSNDIGVTSGGSIGYPYGSDSTQSRYSVTVPVTATASNGNSGSNTLTIGAGSVWNQSIREASVTNLAVSSFSTPQVSGNSYISTISGTYSTTGTGSEGTAVTSTAKNFTITGADVTTVYTSGRGSVNPTGITQASYSTTRDISAIPKIENAYLRTVSNTDGKVLQGRVTITLDNGNSKTQLIRFEADRAYNAVTVDAFEANGSIVYPYKTDSTKSKYLINVPVKATASNDKFGTGVLEGIDVTEVYETGVLEGSTSGSSSGKAYITITGLGRQQAGSGDTDVDNDGYIDDVYQSSTHNTTVSIQAKRYDSETSSVLNTVTGSITVSGLNAYNDGVDDGAETATVPTSDGTSGSSILISALGTMEEDTSGSTVKYTAPITVRAKARGTKHDGSYYWQPAYTSLSEDVDVTDIFNAGKTAGAGSVIQRSAVAASIINKTYTPAVVSINESTGAATLTTNPSYAFVIKATYDDNTTSGAIYAQRNTTTKLQINAAEIYQAGYNKGAETAEAKNISYGVLLNDTHKDGSVYKATLTYISAKGYGTTFTGGQVSGESARLDNVELDVTYPYATGETAGAAAARPRGVARRAASGSDSPAAMSWNGTTLTVPIRVSTNTSSYAYDGDFTLNAAELAEVGLGESVTKVPVSAESYQSSYTYPTGAKVNATTNKLEWTTAPYYSFAVKVTYDDNTVSDPIYAQKNSTTKLQIPATDAYSNGYNQGARTARVTGITLGEWNGAPYWDDTDQKWYQKMSYIQATAGGLTFSGGTVTGTAYNLSNQNIDVSWAYSEGQKNGSGATKFYPISDITVERLSWPGTTNVVDNIHYDSENGVVEGLYRFTPVANGATLTDYAKTNYIRMPIEGVLNDVIIPSDAQMIAAPTINALSKTGTIYSVTKDDDYADAWYAMTGQYPSDVDYQTHLTFQYQVDYSYNLVYKNAYGQNYTVPKSESRKFNVSYTREEIIQILGPELQSLRADSIDGVEFRTGNNITKRQADSSNRYLLDIPVSVNYHVTSYDSGQLITTNASVNKVLTISQEEFSDIFANVHIEDAHVDELVQGLTVEKFYDYDHSEDRFKMDAVVGYTLDGSKKYTSLPLTMSKSKFDSFYEIDLSAVTVGAPQYGNSGGSTGSISVGSMTIGSSTQACFNIPNHISYSVGAASTEVNRTMQVPKKWFDDFYGSSNEIPTGVAVGTDAYGTPFNIAWNSVDSTIGTVPVRVTTTSHTEAASSPYYFTLTVKDSNHVKVSVTGGEQSSITSSDTISIIHLDDATKYLKYGRTVLAEAKANLSDGTTTRFQVTVDTTDAYNSGAASMVIGTPTMTYTSNVGSSSYYYLYIPQGGTNVRYQVRIVNSTHEATVF